MKRIELNCFLKGIQVLIIVLFVLTGCDNRQKSIVQQDEYMLGTLIQAKVFNIDKKSAKKSLTRAFQRVQEIEERFSVNIPTSEVSCINENAGIIPISVNEETIKVLEKSIYYAKLSGGAFDPTIGALVNLWGIGTKDAKVPDNQSLKETMDTIGFNNLIINKDKLTAYLTKSGSKLDLGAIVKGYAADEMKKILVEEGIKTAFLNLGGNVLVIGSKVDGSPWRIGVQNPFQRRGNYIGILETKDQAIVSSGNYERYFEQNNKKYHHILDPNTGYPSDNGLVSVTIITSQSIDADALSTSVYVMGLEKGLDLIENLPDTEAILITEMKKVYITSGLKEKFQLTNGEFSYEKR